MVKGHEGGASWLVSRHDSHSRFVEVLALSEADNSLDNSLANCRCSIADFSEQGAWVILLGQNAFHSDESEEVAERLESERESAFLLALQTIRF